MKIFVVLLNWNGKDDTLHCLRSLKNVKTPHHVILIDNGSSDGSALAIPQEFPDITLIETGKNLGYAEGNNVGIRHALGLEADYIFILNNDTKVDPNILNAFLENAAAPIQGAKTHLMNSPTILDHIGGNWNPQKGEFDLIGAKENAENWTEPLTLDYVCGVALFVKAEVFQKVGLFEPRFFLFWEESDWCLRAKRLGYLASFCPHAKLYHKVSASFTGGKPHTTYFWWRNRLLWIERNCPRKEKYFLFFKVMLPDILHTAKLFLLKSAFSRRTPEHVQRIRTYRAVLTGVKDYILRRFGNGPSWLFQK